MKYWDEVLYPGMLATIRGERYLTMTDAQITDELVNLAKRAIAAFKFPRYSTAYAVEAGTGRYYFTNDAIGFAELEIITTWMKAYWYDLMVSNADNFNNLYYDAAIRTYSPGNTLNNFLKAVEQYRNLAKELESSYYRADETYTPLIGGVDDD